MGVKAMMMPCVLIENEQGPYLASPPLHSVAAHHVRCIVGARHLVLEQTPMVSPIGSLNI